MTAVPFAARLAEARRQVANLPRPVTVSELDQVEAATRDAHRLWEQSTRRDAAFDHAGQVFDYDELLARTALAIREHLECVCRHLARRPIQTWQVHLDAAIACCVECEVVMPPAWQPDRCAWCSTPADPRTLHRTVVRVGGVVASGAACGSCAGAIAQAAQPREEY